MNCSNMVFMLCDVSLRRINLTTIMRRILVYLLLSYLFFSVTSCNMNRQFMFQVPENFKYNELSFDSTSKEYTIQPGDEIQFDLFTNQGASLVELSTGSPDNRVINPDNKFIITPEGLTELPMIGVHKLGGLTPRQAEDYLEEQFSKHFVNPFVVVKLLNRRVMLFNGLGNGRVVLLGNHQVNLIEAIGQAGGLNDFTRADEIRLIRVSDKGQEVYHIDLSKMDGVRFAMMPLQSGDIIYVEGEKRLGQRFAQRIQPWFSLISLVSTTLIIINLFNQ